MRSLGRAGLAVVLSVLGLGGAPSRVGLAEADARLSVFGRVEVTRVELGYRPGDNGLRIRVHLASGQAVELDTTDAEDVQHILALTRVLSSGRAKMFVEIQEGVIRAFQVSVP